MSVDGTLTVVGTKQGITEKSGGWFSIEVGIPGKQYPLKLDTKKQELVELARAAGDNVMEWIYTEVDSGTPNPHRPGSNFINRYFEGVAPVGSTPEATGSVATPAAAAKDGLVGAAKDHSIVRQVCIKSAAELIAGQGPSAHPDYDAALEVMKAAARFEQWIFRDVDPVPFE